MGVLLKPGINLGFEEAELLSRLVVGDEVVADPAVNGGFRRFVGQIGTQLFKVEPLLLFFAVLLVVAVADEFGKAVNLLDEGGDCLRQFVER